MEYSNKNSLLLCLHGHFIFLLNTEIILKLTNYYQRDNVFTDIQDHTEITQLELIPCNQSKNITATINSVKQLNVTLETEKQLNVTLETEKQLNVTLETEK
jgi:hypothetical protein